MCIERSAMYLASWYATISTNFEVPHPRILDPGLHFTIKTLYIDPRARYNAPEDLEPWEVQFES